MSKTNARCLTLLDDARAALLGNQFCASVEPVQPDARTTRRISEVHAYDADEPRVRLYGNQQATLIVDDVPFAAYWQLKEKMFVFHPMVWGRYVHSNAGKREFVARLPELSEQLGTTLPNGGLAFFYPNHYPLSRMCGPELMYSAISQSEALSGYLHAEAHFPDAGLEKLTDRVRDALFLDHKRGGVDLGVAQLEIPLMHANPEIILNGWLHALFNLVDYAIRREDVETAAYVERNLAFFLDNHAVWYDAERHISRYSETCPQRLVLRPSIFGDAAEEIQAFATVYRSKTASLSHYAFVPVQDLERQYGGFDNRVIARNSKTGAITFITTCSGFYDTFIVSEAPFSLMIRPGGYDPNRASPDASGDWERLESQPLGSVHGVEVKLENVEIFRGYPTNFAKANGRNFYHIQHIVALSYLARTAVLDDPTMKARLEAVAQSWFDGTSRYSHKPRDSFEPLQAVLDAINRGKLLMQITRAEELGLDG